MPNFSVRVRVESEQARAALARGEAALSPAFFSTFLRTKVTNYFRMRVMRRFAAEGDTASGKWQPLAAATVKIRQSEGFPGAHPINRRTGDMRRVILDSDPDVIEAGLVSTMTWPSALSNPEVNDKFITAQVGAKQEGRRDTPPRPVIAANEEDVIAIVAMLDLELRLALNFTASDSFTGTGRRVS